MDATAGTAGAYSSPLAGYPVHVLFPADPNESRLWGIPILGSVVRALLLIPHAVALWILGVVAVLIGLLVWIPILLLGRVPDFAYGFYTGLIRWQTRVASYIYLMPVGYPPFSMAGGAHPTRVDFAGEDRSMNRLWGIPFFGWLVRVIILIPHGIVLSILGTLAAFGLLILWIPILLTGRYPALAFLVYGGLLRYSARVAAYALLLPVPYPPFTLRD